MNFELKRDISVREESNKLDVLKEVYQKEISEISDLRRDLEIIVAGRGHLYNPSAKFRSIAEKIFKERGINEKPENFLAYSYAVGNFEYENQLVFDTEDGLILELYRDFAKEIIQDFI